MLAYTYISPGKFELIDKPKPELQSPRDAIVRIALGSQLGLAVNIHLADVNLTLILLCNILDANNKALFDICQIDDFHNAIIKSYNHRRSA